MISTDEEENQDLKIRFGNKIVLKGTKEYENERLKNTEAVKKSRQKGKLYFKQCKYRLKDLKEQNNELENKIKSFNNEMNLLLTLTTKSPTDLGFRIPEKLNEEIKRLKATSLMKNLVKSDNVI